MPANVLSSPRSPAPARVREVISRTVAAVFGGYALAALVAAACARWLPGARVEAVITGMLVSFVVYAAVVIFAFALRGPWRIWYWLLGLGTPVAALLAWSMHGGGA